MNIGSIGIWDVATWIAEALVTFAASTFIFDVIHWLLHRWTKSSVKLLRTFASWHHVHHRFLDGKMQVHADLAAANFWAHLLPEFLTSVAGTSLFYLIFHWIPVSIVILIHVWNFGANVMAEGMDANHMAMDRVSARQNLIKVNAAYHAMHHITPENYFSSYLNLFDLIFGRSCTIRHRRFVITGATGAFGSAMKRRLEALGAIVETARHGVDFGPGDTSRMRAKLARADVLVLAHGAKGADAWDANFTTFVELADLFIEIGKERLVPPEIWAVGSEAELHGDMGQPELADYAASKRAFARRALAYYRSPDVIYRHIVPSAFTSAMGPGLLSAGAATGLALFLIHRGFRYVPVTLTTLAFWNYWRFVLQRPDVPAGTPA
ncbi:MAG TPA: hypothetical protein VHA07_03820 [Devosia sp.]|nr:hypothetical protein [Devosia sp.]